MKNFIVRALCRLGLWGLAFAISPGLAGFYYYKDFTFLPKDKVEEEKTE